MRRYVPGHMQIDGLAQERRNSIANAIDIQGCPIRFRLYWTKTCKGKHCPLANNWFSQSELFWIYTNIHYHIFVAIRIVFLGPQTGTDKQMMSVNIVFRFYKPYDYQY